jgi:hypothetical protein
MPFVVYRKEKNFLIKEKEVPLAGKKGPIFSIVTKRADKEKWQERYKEEDYGIGWEITEKDLLEELNFNSESFSLVIDLKPSVKNNVSLYYLRRIWGYSYSSWTPIALQLETIYVDKEVENSEEFKKKIVIPRHKGDIVHEFLYLKGGIKEGSWVWGRTGSVNGCLLWPDAFNFFVKKILPFTKD